MRHVSPSDIVDVGFDIVSRDRQLIHLVSCSNYSRITRCRVILIILALVGIQYSLSNHRMVLTYGGIVCGVWRWSLDPGHCN